MVSASRVLGRQWVLGSLRDMTALGVPRLLPVLSFCLVVLGWGGCADDAGDEPSCDTLVHDAAGVTADADTRRIDAAGVRMVLTKPVNVTQLLLVLREVAQPQPRVPPAGRRLSRESIQRGETRQKEYDE